jgi:hypothetical protein
MCLQAATSSTGRPAVTTRQQHEQAAPEKGDLNFQTSTQLGSVLLTSILMSSAVGLAHLATSGHYTIHPESIS